jgi:predicted  nucleic acid-binding Zn-ribbon protein
VTHPLLELQAADTMADQLRHRRTNLPEREQVQATRNALVRWNESRTLLRKRLDELAATIERSESESADIDAKRTKLQAQMKTIISPREAEALQKEIAGLEQRRNELDDVELDALEEQARIDDELQEVLAQEETLRDAYLGADAAASAAEADLDGELARVDERLDGLRAAVDAKVLARYDRLRKQHLIAAATLSGSRCEGCHLDLSAAEVDDVREAAASSNDTAECPQCGRLLVVS